MKNGLKSQNLLPAVAELKVEAYSLESFVALDGFGDGHLHLVAQKLRHLVAGLDLS